METESELNTDTPMVVIDQDGNEYVLSKEDYTELMRKLAEPKPS
jgi:hypothetical protein